MIFYLCAGAEDEIIEIMMHHDPRACIIWAHPGFGLATERVVAMLDKHPKLCGSYLPQGIADGPGKLTPE
jgi:hypothetical protein